MEVNAKLQNLRIAPRKVRLVADLIRGKKLDEAQTILGFTRKRGSLSLLKLLGQALNNAKNNFQLDPSNLFISKILVNEGPKLKRWRPRSRGQASPIQKKTSHILIVLDEIRKTTALKQRKKSQGSVPAKKEDAVDKEKIINKEEIAKEERPLKDQVKFKSEVERKQIKPAKVVGGLRRLFKRKAI